MAFKVPEKVFIACGEPSGDAIGAQIAKQIKNRYPDCELLGVCGDLMQSAGVEALFDIRDLSVMGLVEVALHFVRLKKKQNQILQKVLELKPDIFITIDSPDFYLKVSQQVKSQSSKIFCTHIVCPSIYAWRSGRIKKIAKSTHTLMSIFAFEVAFVKHLINTQLHLSEKKGFNFKLIKHPLFEHYQNPTQNFLSLSREKLGISPQDKVLLLLLGSRTQELKKHTNTALKACEKWVNLRKKEGEDWKVVIALNRSNEPKHTQLIQNLSPPQHTIKPIFTTNHHLALEMSDLVLTKSGTITLECAWHQKPMVIFYRTSAITFFIASRLIKVNWVGLPNLIAQKSVFPELLQNDFTTGKVVKHLSQVWHQSLVKAYDFDDFAKPFINPLSALDKSEDQESFDFLDVLTLTFNQYHHSFNEPYH